MKETDCRFTFRALLNQIKKDFKIILSECILLHIINLKHKIMNLIDKF